MLNQRNLTTPGTQDIKREILIIDSRFLTNSHRLFTAWLTNGVVLAFIGARVCADCKIASATVIFVSSLIHRLYMVSWIE